MQVPRRRFIKFLTFGTATSLVGGKLWRRDVLAYCVPSPEEKTAVFKVRLSDYPALFEDYGSVRLGINPVNGDAPDGDFWPILINRDGVGNFHVLDTECRHDKCVVPTYDATEFLIRCPCHNSEYAIDGSVLKEPATQPLFRYPFEYDGDDTLTIQVPCWGFETQLSVLPGGPLSRVRLDFNSFRKAVYEVSFRERNTDSWTPAGFSLTPDGEANLTSWEADGNDASIYLDRTTPSGFFGVSTKLSAV